jgi:hypothetical protein
MNARKFAKITGWSLIIMALIAGFSLGYAYPQFYNPDTLDSTKININQHIGLYQIMLIEILIIAILDLIVSFTLYRYFEAESKRISIASAILRIIYTVFFGAGLFFLSKNLNSSELSNDLIINNFTLFQSLWSAGLVLFGAHLFLIGYLMKIHSRIPKILWSLTLIAGVSYIIIHLPKLILGESDIVNTLEMVLALPMAIGELGLAIWLLARGGKKV